MIGFKIYHGLINNQGFAKHQIIKINFSFDSFNHKVKQKYKIIIIKDNKPSHKNAI